MFLNVNIDNNIHKQLKVFAASKSESMAKIVEKAVVEYITNEEIKAQKEMLWTLKASALNKT